MVTSTLSNAGNGSDSGVSAVAGVSSAKRTFELIDKNSDKSKPALQLTIEERNGALIFDVVFTKEYTGTDSLKALYFHISDPSLGNSLVFSKSTLTVKDGKDPLKTVQVETEPALGNNTVTTVFGDTNINGAKGATTPFDVGVAFVPPKNNQEVISATFTLSKKTGALDLSFIEQQIGARTQDEKFFADINTAPVVAPVSVSGDEDTPIPGRLVGTDKEGDALTYKLADSGTPKNGTVTVAPDGSFSYQGDKDFHGTDTFTVLVTDAKGGTTTSVVEVLVKSVNDAPTAGSISASGQQDETVRGKVTGLDVDRDALTYKLADDGAPKNGMVTVKGDGTFSYTGDKDFHGTDTFKVLIEDGKGGQTTSLVTVTVKPAPDGSGQNGGNGNSAKYDDLIEAGDGDDWIHGGLGDDEMQGEGGNDTIYGGQDNGKIGLTSSGAVNEVRIGDNLYGNDGRDVYHYGNGDGVDMIWDFRAGEDVIKISGFEADDVKVVYLGALSNRIGTGNHAKLALILGDGKGAIVFNDLPRPDSDAVMLQFATGTKRELTWSELLSKANLTAVDAPSSTNSAGTEAGTTPDPVSADAPIEISGVRGNDYLTGGGGADRLYGNEGYNWLEGLGGNDQLFGGNDKDVLIGGDGKDRLYGNEGDNWLEANAGMDELYGGNAKDVMLGGSENDVGYGNGGDDWIVGGSGSDKLYGAGGADIIFGDDYIDGLISGGAPARPEKPQVDPEQPSPWVISEGRFLFTKTSMTMADDVQKVTATGTASITITGNSLDNIIIGNTGKNTVKAGAGNDAVDGGYGNDSLSGGTGDDRFIFSSKLGSDKTDRKVNFDKIADFSAKDDTIELDNKIFKKLGKAGDLKSSFFTVGTEAKDANDYLIYNKATGVLSYDADGSGSKAAVEFAQLKKGLVLKYSDFDVI